MALTYRGHGHAGIDALPTLASGPNNNGDEWELRSGDGVHVLGHCLDSVGLMRYWTGDTLAELIAFAGRSGDVMWIDADGPVDIADVIREHDGDELRCPACGDPVDYCAGHGDIGDPTGAAILAAHDDGDHDACHPMGCEDAAE